MKIMLISPKHGKGLTTVSALISDMCAREFGVPCLLTQTDPLDESLDKYLDLAHKKDKMMSIRQINKLLEVGEISGTDIADYTVKKGKLGVFDIFDTSIVRSNSDCRIDTKLLNKILDTANRQLVFIDVADEIYEPETQSLIEDADYYIVVIDQSINTLNQFLAIKESEYWDKFKEKDFLIVVNNFNKNISSINYISKKLGVRSSKILKIHYNPFIAKAANDGTLLCVNDFGLDGDFRYIDVLKDIMNCADVIAANLAITFDKLKIRR